MAIKIDLDNIKNITEYPNSFKRQGAFPLERYSIFDTLEDAKDYAKNNSIAYVGQLLTVVVAENNVSMYKIVDANGTLVQIDGEVAIPDAPEYTIVKEVVDGKHQFYLAKEGDKVGESISFSDMVVTGGELVTFTDADKPEGLDAGTYLKLTIADQETPVYINVKELIDVYIGGSTDTITVSINSSEDGNKITAVVNKKSITGGADGHIALSTITAENISNNAIIERTIVDGAVTTNKIANKAVTTAKIADKAVTVAKLADDVLTHFSTPDHKHILNDISDLSDLAFEHEAEDNKFITGIIQENGKIISVLTAEVDVTNDISAILSSIDNTLTVAQPTTANGTINIISSIVQTDAKIESVGTQTIDIGSVIGLSDYLLASKLTATSPELATKQVTKDDKLVVKSTMDSAIGALDSTLTANVLSAKDTGKINIVKSLTQTDGKLSQWIFEEVDISTVIKLSDYVKTSDLTTAYATKEYVNGVSSSLSNTVAANYLSVSAFKSELEKYTHSKFSNPITDQEKLVNKQYVDSTFAKIDNVMHFKGVVDVDPLEESTQLTGYANGDVVIYGAHEYVFVKPESETKGTWEQFGDQSIDHSKYALKSEVSNHISAVEIVDNTNTVVETLSSTNHKIKLGTMAQAQTDSYYTKEEADARFVIKPGLIIDCGGASDEDLTPTETDEKWFEIATSGTLTAFTATSADLGTTVVVVPQTVDSIEVKSVGTVFKNNTWITAVYIPVGIDIPAGAFDGCTSLPKDDSGVMYTN